MTNLDTLIIKEDNVILQEASGKEILLPNLTSLVALYKTSKNTEVGNRLKKILQCDLGSLLVVEIMIDVTNPVTLERLKSGEISKNMKHVYDYYVILNSQLSAAEKLFNLEASKGNLQGNFESCKFNTMPFGTVIIRNLFPSYVNTHCNKETINSLILD